MKAENELFLVCDSILRMFSNTVMYLVNAKKQFQG